jgi:succinyl-diaminopimelate desuccinylase
MVNQNRLIRLTQKLIRINSSNPPGNESEIARFIKDYLSALNLETKIYEFKKNRSNLVAILAGKDNRRSLLISPHLDTVPAGGNWKVNPFSGQIKNKRIYGLGATDCKGNLACALEAINSIVEDKVRLDYKLIFCATADEETGSGLGLIPLLHEGILKPDVAIILDADDSDIIVTQKGLIHLKVKIQGKRAHGAYPWRGINAIDIAIDIIKEIKAHKFSYTKQKYLRPPTLNVGTIKGGDKVNIVADWCEFELDFRFLPGTKAKDILNILNAIIKKEVKKFSRRDRAPKIAGKMEIEGIQEPYFINQKHPLIMYLVRAMKNVKACPSIKGSEGATVITFFRHKNIPAVATGFGTGGQAHVTDEYVKIRNLYKGALALVEFLKNYRF